MIVYIVHQLAKEINGDFVSSSIELVTEDPKQAETYAMKEQAEKGIMKIEDHLCRVVRQVVPAEVQLKQK